MKRVIRQFAILSICLFVVSGCSSSGQDSYQISPTLLTPAGVQPGENEFFSLGSFEMRDSHPLDEATYTEHLNYFAQNIQPILQGTASGVSTAQNTCTSCHISGRLGMVGFKTCEEPFSGSDECVQHNYGQLVMKGNLSYENSASSRALGVLRGHGVMDDGIPGVYHMDQNFSLENQAAIYTTLRSWVDMEKQARGSDLGVDSTVKQLCFIAREQEDWEARVHYGPRNDGKRAKIYCGPIDANHQLVGNLVDVTAFLGWDNDDKGYDIERLVAGYGENDEFALYTGYRENARTGKNRYNLMKISLTIDPSSNLVTAATADYVLPSEWRNSGYISARVDETGYRRSRAADDFPSDVYFGRVVFDSDRGNPEWDLNPNVAPDHPDPNNPFQQDPRVGRSSKVNFPESYHGGSESVQIFQAAQGEVPKLLLPHRGMFTRNATLGLNGKVMSEAWFNRYDGSAWIQQFIPDVENGSIDDIPPWIDRTDDNNLQGSRWEQMAMNSFHQLFVTNELTGLSLGGSVQVSHHDLGVPFHGEPEDQAPSVYHVRETGAENRVECDVDDDGENDTIHLTQGFDRNPVRSLDGARVVMVSTNEPYNQCGVWNGERNVLAPPQDVGIVLADHVGNLQDILKPSTHALAYFDQGYFVDRVALVAKKQLPSEFVHEKLEHDVATVNVNVFGRLLVRDRNSRNKEALFNEIVETVSHVRVYRTVHNPYGHADTRVADQARGFYDEKGSHPGIHGVEFGLSSIILDEIPVAADGSIAFRIQAGTGYFLQYLKTVDTSKGPLRLAFRQEEQIHIAKAGLNNLAAPKDFADYVANCQRCHGDSASTYRGIEAMVRDPGAGSVSVNRADTLAMQSPVDLYSNPVGNRNSPTGNYYFMRPDYFTQIQPMLEQNQCLNCHNASVSETRPPGDLMFDRDWSTESADFDTSLRWTARYPSFSSSVPAQFNYEGEVMGAEAPFMPGYALLQKKDANNRYLYMGSSGGLHRGTSSSGLGLSIHKCGLWFATFGVEVDCPNGPIDFYGNAFTPPSNHAEMLSLNDLQNWARTVDAGWDYRMDFMDPAPSDSFFAGETRVDLGFEIEP